MRTGAHHQWMRDEGVEFVSASSTVAVFRSKLSGGATAGIVVAILLAAIAAATLALYFHRRRRGATAGAGTTKQTEPAALAPASPIYPVSPPGSSTSALATAGNQELFAMTHGCCGPGLVESTDPARRTFPLDINKKMRNAENTSWPYLPS